MATTENLKVKITADASQAKAEIGKFKDSLKGTVSEAEVATKSLGKMTAALGAVAVAAKGVKALLKNAIDVAATGDAIKDNAQKVFMGTTAYQEWGYVLKQNGIEIASLKTGMRQFAQKVAAGDAALARYGITANNVDEAFEQAIANIQNMSTETEKIAAATELFGTRALELMPILNMTNAETQGLMETYRAIGGTMSNELIAASDVCTDSITAMRAAWGGLRNVLAAYFIPIITKVVQWITVAIAKVRILLAAIFGLKETFGGGSSKKTSLAGASGSVATNTGNTAKNLGKANKAAKELKRTLMGIDELTKLVEQATASSAGNSGGGVGGGGDVGGIGDIGDAMDDVFTDEMLEKIQKFKEKIDGVKDVLNGLYLILKGLVEISFGNFRQGLDDIWEGLKKIFPVLETFEEAWARLKETVKKKIEAFVTVTLPKWSGDLKEKWANLKARFADFTKKLKLELPKWSNLKAKWQALKQKFTGWSVGLSLDISAKLSTMRAWINSNVIGPLNNAIRSVVPNFGGIPYLHAAKGAGLTAPTAVLAGEYPGAKNNPEVISPQSLMLETMQRANGDMVAAFAQMTRDVIAAIEGKDMSVNIGDEQIARSAQRGNTAYRNRTGKALLTI